jgi:hypothetical protein
MPGTIPSPDEWFQSHESSLLERVFFAEYLLSRGYLVSDLSCIPPRQASRLQWDAAVFTRRRMAEIKPFGVLPWDTHLPICLN